MVQESTAGRNYFLPLGMRVHDKIMKIIEEEMDMAGAQKMITPVLHPLELWQETNRTKTTGFELMKVNDRRGAQFALGGTAEEMFVELVRKFKLSYKDLPINVYQFSTKFRDELRARGGLLRMREFTMKDAYSFDKDEESFKKEYEKMAKTYTRIFKRMGLETVKVEADNGYIGGEYCHEFVVESPIGESHYYVSPDGKQAIHEDIANDQTKKTWIKKQGIEVGNIFQLGYHYTNLMKGAEFVDSDGKLKKYYMGCYGIGLGRTMAAVVEKFHDEKGIIWPKSIAPYPVHLIELKSKNEKRKTEEIYKKLTGGGIEILWDDREEVSAGVKFADADLIGIPVRLVTSARNKDMIEWKNRNSIKTELLSLEAVETRLR